MKKQSFWQNLPTLRFLAGFWGFITMVLFMLDFWAGHDYNISVTAASAIYGTILALYVGSKEYERWCQKKGNYRSQFWGEIYIVLWTLLMALFVIIAPFSGGYLLVPAEFPAVYLTVISIFILSRQSKKLKSNKWLKKP